MPAITNAIRNWADASPGVERTQPAAPQSTPATTVPVKKRTSHGRDAAGAATPANSDAYKLDPSGGHRQHHRRQVIRNGCVRFQTDDVDDEGVADIGQKDRRAVPVQRLDLFWL
jgi:hypothetical protein